jgi:hypothetical protein
MPKEATKAAHVAYSEITRSSRPLQSSASGCPSLTLPVGHAVPKKFGSVSPCYILLRSLCRAHLTVLLAQRLARQFRRRMCRYLRDGIGK